MASIRRTLSPVPRPGTSMNGEACLVASPLSKSSTSTQNYPHPVVSASFSSFDYALYRAQTFILGLFSRRSSRPLERPKTKGQVWRRSLLHFFICFVVGVFYGMSPSALMNLSVNLSPKNQEFSFIVPRQLEKVELSDAMPRNDSPIVESSNVNNTFGLPGVTLEFQNGTSDDTNVMRSFNEDLNETHAKLLIIVTPTYARPFQAYHLNRLAHTLKAIPPPLLWIVVEMGSQSAETSFLLMRSGVMYRHLVCDKNLTDVKDKAVHQRNVALSHIETHRLNGIVYFADDDNIYSVNLFVHMRQISRFGTWLVAKLMERNTRPILEGPVCNGTAVIGWHTSNTNSRVRRFHAEVSGFAFNSTILWDPKKWHRPTIQPIRQLDTVSGRSKVSTFIEQVVEDESQMECLLLNSSRIMVWHLHVESSFSYSPHWLMKHNNLNVTIPLV